MVSYDYSSQNRRWWRTNAPPLWAIWMAMAVRRCHTERIAQCSMTRALLEATVRRHRRLPTPYCPGSRQGDSKQNNNTKCVHFADHFNGHVGATVLYRTHPPMEEVKGFHKNHQRPPSGKHSLRYHQSDTPTPYFGGLFNCQNVEKGFELPL